MKSLCACAALAVATAVAHGSFGEAIAQGKNTFHTFRQIASKLTPIADNQHCTEEINEWRRQVDPSAKQYEPNANGNPTNDLKDFLSNNECEALKAGKFAHILTVDDGNTFVFSASRPSDIVRDEMGCSEALEQWKKGFSDFAGKYPEQFQQNTGAYGKPNAVGLVSLLSEKSEKIYCGNPTGCDAGTLICYIKPPAIQERQYPVTAQMWHKVEESFSLKPKVTVLGDAELEDYLEEVNDVREVDGLNLPKFTAVWGKKSMRLTKSTPPPTAYENVLYNLTCAEIDASSINPKVKEEYTIIYAVKNGKTPPTADEAVEFWKTGYTMLGPEVPPAFQTKESSRAEVVDGGIYYNSAVAGFVSLMVDASRKLMCYSATGCEKAALICFLSDPTLVEGEKPISENTWEKILALDREESDESANKKIHFAKRDENHNCLTEINEFRTQDSLDLDDFDDEEEMSTDPTDDEVAKYDSEELAKVVTCDALKAGNAPILISNNKRSVMYYSGSNATCSNAVTEWKKGYEKFKDVTIPPKYTPSENMYKSGAATNFISLVSEGEDTVARCYTVENCSEEGLVCVLEPAVFEEGKLPISEATWKNVTKTLSNSVRAPSIYGALLRTAFLVVGLFALNL